MGAHDERFRFDGRDPLIGYRGVQVNGFVIERRLRKEEWGRSSCFSYEVHSSTRTMLLSPGRPGAWNVLCVLRNTPLAIKLLDSGSGSP